MTEINPKRVLLKLSGETLSGNDPFGINVTACHELASALASLQQKKLQIALVIGGGNIFRGAQLISQGMPRAPADYMGMLATLINGIALQEALIAKGCKAVAMSSLDCPKAVLSYDWRQARNFLETGHLLIFVGGTGYPYFTTDTAAAVRACEIGAHVLWKATNVDGIYPDDPRLHPHLKKFDHLSYSEILAQKLKVMDATAVTLCRDNNIPIYVFNKSLLRSEQFPDLLKEGSVGTTIDGD